MDKDFLLNVLLETPRIARKSARKIINSIDDSNEIINTKDYLDLLNQSKYLHPEISLPTINDLELAKEKAKKTYAYCMDNDIKIITWFCEKYPTRLRNIQDPPLVLYCKGNYESLNNNAAAAVIGTREPSDFGRKMAKRLGYLFASENFIVVSGLAVGCDTGGHEGCLLGKGITVAVLANGLNTIYPASNKDLAKKIIEAQGCLVSEYPPLTKTNRSSFVERDRIQAGLSDLVVVVETDIKGGTMHTVQFALDENRLLACLDHPVKYQNLKSNGNTYLIENKKCFSLKDENDFCEIVKKVFTYRNQTIHNHDNSIIINTDATNSERYTQFSLFEEGHAWD
jgi:DNA processing protein